MQAKLKCLGFVGRPWGAFASSGTGISTAESSISDESANSMCSNIITLGLIGL